MARYSDFADRLLLQPDLLKKLRPGEPLAWDLAGRVKNASTAELFGEAPPASPAPVELVRGALFYAVDALDAGHRIFQDAPSDLGSYWHGMMHRREGDFDNARYWFRRAGALPFFKKLHRSAGEVSALMARQTTWDPYLFTSECEQARFGAENGDECAKVQRAEFEAVFDYTWRQALAE